MAAALVALVVAAAGSSLGMAPAAASKPNAAAETTQPVAVSAPAQDDGPAAGDPPAAPSGGRRDPGLRGDDPDFTVPHPPVNYPPSVAADAVLAQLHVSYELEATVHWRTGTSDWRETVTIVNGSAARVATLNFSVIPRSGGLFTLRGRPVVSGQSIAPRWTTGTNLAIDLPRTLAPGGTVRVELAYRLARGKSKGELATRVGWGAGILNLGNAIPVLSREHDVYSIGDPSVGHSADSWVLDLATDVAMGRDAVATSGELVTGPAVGSKGRHWRFRASSMREFALAISPAFRRTSARVGATTISAYTVRMAPAALLNPAVAAFRTFSRWYGQYPRPTVAVVEIGPAGYSQEFSGLVFIAPDVSAPRYVAHEIAHLWWFDLVGNDQILDPFLDEALAEYSSRVVSHVDDPSCSTRPLAVSVFAFKPEKTPAQERSCKGYFRTIYRRGALFWHDAQKLLGTTALRRALRDFAAAHRFGLVDTATLLDAVEAAVPSRATDLRALEAEYGLRGPAAAARS